MGACIKPFCEAKWIGSIFESVNACVLMETHAHIHAWTNTLLPLPGWYHYPSVYPQFAISQPNWSHPINVFDLGGAYLSPSHPLSLFLFLHHTTSLSLLHHPHTTLSCQQIASVSQLLKYPAPLCSLPFSAVRSNYFYVLLKNFGSPACSNLPLTPLLSLYLTFL